MEQTRKKNNQMVRFGRCAIFWGRGAEKRAIRYGLTGGRRGYYRRRGCIVSTSYGLVSGYDTGGHWWDTTRTVQERMQEIENGKAKK